ncbi:hypothetical protein HYZ99_01480 [Candidatus Peregrinibacteria bacterium]|nr:hypothetical protein [Candidatus Peregrinibacteria bacterium]
MLVRDFLAWRAMKRLSTKQAASLLALTYFGQWGWRKYRRMHRKQLRQRRLQDVERTREEALLDRMAD